jgi:hypothetical protein
MPINGHNMIKTAAEINIHLTRRNRIYHPMQLLVSPALSQQPCQTQCDTGLEYIMNVRLKSNKGPLLKFIHLYITVRVHLFIFQFKLWPLLKCAQH